MIKGRFRRTAVAASLALTAALIAGCTSSPESGSGSGGAGTASGPAPTDVTVGIRSDIDTFDPYTTLGDFGAQQMSRLVYSTLVRRTIDGEIVQQVATSWEVTPDSGVFHIREGETCSDGSPLTPSVIARSLTRLTAPETGSPYANRLFPGGGGSVVGDDAAGTVTIALQTPNSDMLAALANVGTIVCGAGLTDPASLARSPSGAGPYTLVNSTRGDSYEFQRRDDFRSLPDGTTVEDMPERLTLRVVSDDSAMVNAILTGEVDTGGVFGRDGQRLEQGGEYNTIRGEALSVEGMTLNHEDGLPGADADFRAAISLAIDPELYTRAATFGRGQVSTTIYTPNMDCYSEANTSIVPPSNVDEAGAALDEAGYRLVDGRRTKPDGSPLTLRLVGSTDQNSGPQYIADVLGRIGFDVDTAISPKDQAIATVFDGGFDVFVYPFTSSLGTPVQLVGAVRGDLTSSVNVARIANPRFDAIADKATTDIEKRCEFWQDAEKVLLEDSEAKPLTQPITYYYAKGLTFQASYYLIDPYTIRSSS